MVSNQIRNAIMPGLVARFDRLYNRSALGAVSYKRARLYAVRVHLRDSPTGAWVLRREFQRW